METKILLQTCDMTDHFKTSLIPRLPPSREMGASYSCRVLHIFLQGRSQGIRLLKTTIPPHILQSVKTEAFSTTCAVYGEDCESRWLSGQSTGTSSLGPWVSFLAAAGFAFFPFTSNSRQTTCQLRQDLLKQAYICILDFSTR